MQYQTLLDQLVSFTRVILGERLTGIYLHGSLAMGCFHPKKSDIDLIVVTDDEITDSEKLSLMRQIVALNRLAPAKGLEISVVKKEYCTAFVYPTPYELHFSPMHLQRYLCDPAAYVRTSGGVDKDLAAHFTVIRKYGMVLYGEEIRQVFSEVPRQDYADSIFSDIEQARTDIVRQPVYTVLNLCRALAFLTDGGCLSKKDGGLWAQSHLPPELLPIVSEALACYAGEGEMTASDGALISFATGMLHLIRNRMAATGVQPVRP